MKLFTKKVKIKTYYNLDGEYLLFKHNPLHDKVFENVNVEITTEEHEMLGTKFKVNMVYIEGEKPIECELVDVEEYEDTLIISICQDWG